MQTYSRLTFAGLAASFQFCSNGQTPLPPSHRWLKHCNLFGALHHSVLGSLLQSLPC